MHSQSQLALDRHLDIWNLILDQLLSLGHGRKNVLAPLVTVSRQLSAVATTRIWEELDSLYPLLALFYTRTGSYHDWEWNAIAQTTRCLNGESVHNGEIQTDLASWGRYEHYASHVRTLTVRMDGAYRNWIFLLPIKRLAATRHKVRTTIGDQTLDCFPPLLPNLVSLTFELQYSQNLDHAIAVLTAPSAQLLGIEALAGLLLLMPPTLRHLGIVWTNNSISELFTSILDKFTKEMANPASPIELKLGLVGTDYGFLHNLPGDYLTAIPRSGSLVSFRGFSASVFMIEVLGNLPCLSEIELYHMPGREVIPYAHEYVPRLPNGLDHPYPSIDKLRLLICHKEVEDACRILSHFPIERLQDLELEFTRAYGVPQVHFMEPVFALVGRRARALRAFSLVYDAEMWDYIPPSWDVENNAYSLSPWPSLVHLLGCHGLESLVIKCAGVYHGLVLSNDDIKVLGSAWPHLRKFCISETLLGVDVVKQSTRPRLVNMGDLCEIALAFPLLDTLHLTLDVDHVSTFASLRINYDRPATRPLDLDLGYSPLVGNIAGTVARQLLTVWPGLRSLRTYWKEHRPVGVHAIYLNKWREVLRFCGSSVVDGHNTNRCNDGYEEQAYWKAV